jgi:hypothetical protein
MNNGCFADINVGLYKANEGYKTTWTDVYDFPDKKMKEFQFMALKQDGDIYF